MILLAYRHGVRTSEVCMITMGDVDLESRRILETAKPAERRAWLVPRRGLEPPTCGLGIRRSVLLSYRGTAIADCRLPIYRGEGKGSQHPTTNAQWE